MTYRDYIESHLLDPLHRIIVTMDVNKSGDYIRYWMDQTVVISELEYVRDSSERLLRMLESDLKIKGNINANNSGRVLTCNMLDSSTCAALSELIQDQIDSQRKHFDRADKKYQQEIKKLNENVTRFIKRYEEKKNG